MPSEVVRLWRGRSWPWQLLSVTWEVIWGWKSLGQALLWYPTTLSHPGYVCSEVNVAQACPPLCDPVGSTVHGTLQARMLEWVAVPFSRGSPQPSGQTQASHTAGRFFTGWVTGKSPVKSALIPNHPKTSRLRLQSVVQILGHPGIVCSPLYEAQTRLEGVSPPYKYGCGWTTTKLRAGWGSGAWKKMSMTRRIR